MPEATPAAPQAPAAAPAVTETPVAPASGQEAAPPPPIVETVDATPTEKVSPQDRAKVLRAKAMEALMQGVPKTPPANGATGPQTPATPATSGLVTAEPGKPAEAAKPTAEALADPFSKQFQALAVQQAEVRREREAMKAEKSKGADAYMLEMRELARKDPSAVLERTGLTYQQLTSYYLDGKLAAPDAAKPDASPLAAEIAELKAWKQAQEAKESQASRAQQAATFRANVSTAAKAGGEKFELVAAGGERAAQRVVDVLEEHYRITGEIPGGSMEEALRLGMAHVEAALEAESLPLLQTAKLKRKLATEGTPLAAPRPNAESGQPSPSASAPRTLTNSLAGAAAPRTTRKTSAELRADALRVLEKGIPGT